MTGAGRRGGGTALALALVAAGCVTVVPKPEVRYAGVDSGRKPTDLNRVEIHRLGPPRRSSRDLGTVTVTCPSELISDGVGGGSMVGGCSWDAATYRAAERAGQVGADGIHSIEASTNSAGKVVSLRASVFVFRAPPPGGVATAPTAAPAPAAPTIEERLRRLDKLKADKLITPEEHAAKRAEILKEL